MRVDRGIDREENSCRRGVREVPRRQSFLGKGTYQRAVSSISEIIPEKQPKRISTTTGLGHCGGGCTNGLTKGPWHKGLYNRRRVRLRLSRIISGEALKRDPDDDRLGSL
jgi:hypothetical protein